MFFPGYYQRPYYMNNGYYNKNIVYEDIKKDTASNDTIPFSTDTNCKNNDSNSKSLSLFGITLEIDDLIIIGLIILLFLQKDKNYTLIIVLGLILLNINLNDIFSLSQVIFGK